MIVLRRDALGLARTVETTGLMVRSCLVLAMLAAAPLGCRKTAPVSPAPSAASAAMTEAPAAPPPRGRQLTLLYSSNLDGQYAPCDCVQPAGGVARRVTMIGRARREADDTLVVDAGDLFDA